MSNINKGRHSNGTILCLHRIQFKIINNSKQSVRNGKKAKYPNFRFEVIVLNHQCCKEAAKEIRKALEVYLEKVKEVIQRNKQL